jgi:hypothetical protein
LGAQALERRWLNPSSSASVTRRLSAGIGFDPDQLDPTTDLG